MITAIEATEEHIEQALDALNKMSLIVRNDMLMRGEYLTPDIVDYELAKKGAICGGHKACAVGSLYLAAGVRRERRELAWSLPGAYPHERPYFMASRPALRVAYEALNAAAERYCGRHGIDLDNYTRYDAMTNEAGMLERLFEATYVGTDDVVIDAAVELPKIINSAKRALRRQAALAA
jgi:hypothetical protein